MVPLFCPYATSPRKPSPFPLHIVYIFLMTRPFIIAMLLTMAPGHAAGAEEDYGRMRNEMAEEIKDMAMDTRDYLGNGNLDSRIIEVMQKVPRHEFVPEAYRQHAYRNRALPIGNEQTISQPYIVALMTDLANVDQESVVLEVGTGSGYQAAVLAELVKHVYSIEIIEALGKTARETLERLGYDNITLQIGDGYHGWPEHAPFDAILVTAAPEEVPEPLIEQLKPGGRIVIPVGPRNRTQSLRVLEKDASGTVKERDVLPVGFVPLTRSRN